MKKCIFVTGSKGLVGSRFVELYSSKYHLLTPEIEELNLLDKEKINKFLNKHKPQVVVHFAAFTDVSEAENQRDTEEEMCWQVNVEGTKNLITSINPDNTQFIHISTDMVFPGNDSNPGPYSEDTTPGKNSQKLTWYGFTKAEAERLIQDSLGNNAVILRIICPVRAKYALKLDYLRKPLKLFDQGKLYPLFRDQQVTISYIDEVCMAIDKIIEKRAKGIFHASSSNTATPHEIVSYLIEKTRGKKGEVESSSIDEFLKTVDNPVRYSKYGGLRVEKTQERLNLKFSTWQEIVNKLVDQGLGT